MATYVLVGGAWIGGWAWQRVARRLRQRGHDVYPVTLTGLGERVHLARPEVDLETFIADVVNLLTFEDLAGVTLVGHSYAGIVISGVADRAPERVARLVFCDSAPFVDGEAYLDILPADAQTALRGTVASTGDGWRLPFPSIEDLGAGASLRGLDDADLALLQARATPHPFASYAQPLRLGMDAGTLERVATPERWSAPERAVIACDGVRTLVGFGVPRIVEMTREPWRYVDLDTGHWPMLSAPGELATALHDLAR